MRQAVRLSKGWVLGFVASVFRSRLFSLIGVPRWCFTRSRLIRDCRGRCGRSRKRFSRFECGAKCERRPEKAFEDVASKRTFSKKPVSHPVIKSYCLPGVRNVDACTFGNRV